MAKLALPRGSQWFPAGEQNAEYSRPVSRGPPSAPSADRLPFDLVGQQLIRVVPLKGARAEEEGRLIPVASATARSIAVYLRAGRYYRLADSPFVWLGLRNGGPIDAMGLHRMLRRRAEQTCYKPAAQPDISAYFRPGWLASGVSERD